MDPILPILVAIGGVFAGMLVAKTLYAQRSTAVERAAEAEAQKILEAARSECQELQRAAELEGREHALKIRNDAEHAAQKRRNELSKREQELSAREEELTERQRHDKKAETELKRREQTIAAREEATEAMTKKVEALQASARQKLESIAGMSSEQAARLLTQEVTEEARRQAAAEIKAIEDKAREEAVARSKEIIATAVQRYASEFVAERTVAVVHLPSDDMKGRLIGREGRNIRALEAAAGIDLIIDDTSEVITVSCFNPVRREIGRLAISRLVADGRIHPTRIEEVVTECEAEVEEQCRAAGEQAVFDLGLHRVHPELVRHLGRLKFRSSYAQNVLDHSVEVGFLAGLMAAEIGISVKAARRAGLLHDIGKAVDHEQEGSHSEVGAQFARKHGESPRVCQAIACHHGDVPAETVLDHIIDGANQLSGARPGARRELLASYIKRLEDLEKLASSYSGVTRAFAVQMGREVRVMVENSRVDDAAARLLSKDIATRIENEAAYPGQVRVVVVRETRASDYAR